MLLIWTIKVLQCWTYFGRNDRFSLRACYYCENKSFFKQKSEALIQGLHPAADEEGEREEFVELEEEYKDLESEELEEESEEEL